MANIEIRVNTLHIDCFEKLVSISCYYGEYDSVEQVFVFEEDNAPDLVAGELSILAEKLRIPLSIRITD